MGSKQKVPANLPGHVVEHAQAMKQHGQVVPTIEEFAAREAEMIERSTFERAKHWVTVMRTYAHDVQILERYPGLVRHAFAKRLGIDLSKSRKEWPISQRKLYDSFAANQVSPLSLMITLAVGSRILKTQGIGVEAVCKLLEGPGNLPAKVREARVLLGKPVRQRSNNKNKKQEPESVEEIVSTLSRLGSILKQNGDPLARLLGERISAAVAEYEQKNDTEGKVVAAA